MARGRSTSSSPEPHRRRGKRDRRTSRRSRSPRRKSTGLPVETPSSSNTFKARYTLPKAWTPGDIYLDRQQEYKLTFPRRVIATAWSRELQIDHRPIVRMYALLTCSVANRRTGLYALSPMADWSSSRDSEIVKRPIPLVLSFPEDFQELRCRRRPHHRPPSPCFPQG